MSKPLCEPANCPQLTRDIHLDCVQQRHLVSTNQSWISRRGNAGGTYCPAFQISHLLQFSRGRPCKYITHRRTGEHPFGGSNRVLPEWRKQLVCHAAPPGRKNNNELLQCLFLTVVDRYPRRLYPMNVSFVTPPEMYLR